MSTTAIRRHHIDRLKAKVLNLPCYWDFDVATGEHYLPDSTDLGILVNTLKMCSCPGCGNPRRHFSKKTRQELISAMDYDA